MLPRRVFRITIVVAVLLITAAVLAWVAIKAFQPLPGRDLVIAAGPPGSAYAQYAERYREVMARDGVRLRLVPTYGAVENLARLQDGRSGVMAGFVQSGTTTEQA